MEEGLQIALSIGYGTVWAYTWRTIKLLRTLLSEFIRWPLQSVAHPIEGGHRVFRHCIGFIDGSNIDKPMVDPEAYFSRKKNYGFNLQAICNWEGRFIWASMAHTASAHDWPAWKSTALYQAIESYFHPEEYLLADKAYALERHIITPYKEPTTRQPLFNYALSIPQVKIEHAVGVLKVRCTTLYEIQMYLYG